MNTDASQQFDTVRAIIWNDETNTLELLDQRLLPKQTTYVTLNSVAEVTEAIRDMVVRGAPAIGITAAFGVVIAARDRINADPDNWKENIQDDLELLAGARPTAVNLFWAIEMMREIIEGLASPDPVATLLTIAKRVHEDDIAANYAMGEMGACLIEDECAILTHCNTGSLATGGYGTALGVIRSAVAEGKCKHVYADETRPWLQGARLTAWELVQDQIPVSLLVEGAAGHMMKTTKETDAPIGWVIVGSDRIAANGDVANKIGTYNLAVLAKHHGVKFMVVAPTTTVDMNIKCGDDIPIEERGKDEVLTVFGDPIAAEGSDARNPAFDVTPAELIDAIVTEKGIVRNPTPEKMMQMMTFEL